MILTNDGEFAHRVGHPRFEIQKTYRVTVPGRVPDAAIEKLRAGVRVAEFRATFDRVRLVKRSDSQTLLEVTLIEGKNREIRRVFARLKLPVRALRRVRIGGIGDRGLKIGHWRPLTRQEVEGLLEPRDYERQDERPRRRPVGAGRARGNGGHGGHGGHGRPGRPGRNGRAAQDRRPQKRGPAR